MPLGMWTAMRPYARQVAGLLTIGSLCGVLMNTAVVLPAILLGHAVDTVLEHDRGEVDGGAVTRAVLLLIAGTLATEVPRIGKRYWLGVCRNRIKANVRADAVGGVLSWPADRLHRTSVGEVMGRVVGDVEVLGRGVGEVIVETWDTLLFSLALAVAILIYDPTLGLLALAPVPVALALAKAVGTRVSRRTLRAREANAAVTSFAQEGLTGLRALRASGRGGAYAARLRALADEQAGAELAAGRLEAVLAPVYTLLVTSGVLAIIGLGGHRVVGGELSVGDLVALLGLFGRFTGRAFRIPQMVNRVQAADAAYSRLAPLLAAPPALAAEPRRSSWHSDRIAGLPDEDRVTTPPAVPSPRRGPAQVSLQQVAFTYPGAGTPALRGVTLDVAPGDLVAVTGAVGSGKSALARVVAGLYPPDSGQVRVDGADPHAWQPDDRTVLGYLPQGHPVFSGTVADNVLLPDPGRPGDHSRLEEALAVAALEEEVAAMPSGTGTGIGELGVQVSGGQRQRIALARSLAAPVVRPRLLVLDDPFSALDLRTEARIVGALRAAVGPDAPVERRATVLLFSTRLASFPRADLVVVLDGGQIAEQGGHEALIGAGGLYARIFRAQRQAAQPPVMAGTASDRGR
ncbi:ABC transporter ATP-binding protein [Geodermatophilus sp. CPCC 205761]|uniref:ABC transporter ATP-binding protein n=1 Tax=Geodermatophilus sp. CPCC 205761 TaxID=2936597 RepID=UPI003EEB865C